MTLTIPTKWVTQFDGPVVHMMELLKILGKRLENMLTVGSQIE